MPVIRSLDTTRLKSLKYGSDRPGGGDSGLPYITTDINTVDRPINRLRLTKFDDGLIRGGAIGALNSSIVDTIRISKFFIDFPKGPLFIAKQVGLQLSNPRLETKQLPTNRPTTGQGFFNNIGNFIANAANTLNNAVGPTRIYNLGINTLAQVPINAFGGHIVRHGLLPVQNENTKYEAVVTSNNQNGTNRLLKLIPELGIDQFPKLKPTTVSSTIGRNVDVSGRRSVFASITNQETIDLNRPGLLAPTTTPPPPPRTSPSIPNVGEEIKSLSYSGGPGSLYGIIGRTAIRRHSNTEDTFKIDESITYSNIFAGATRNEKGDRGEEVKIKNTQDFELSTKSTSSLNPKGWKYTDGNTLNGSFLNNNDILKNTSESLERSKNFVRSSTNNINVYNTLGLSKQYSNNNKDEIKILTEIDSNRKSIRPNNAFEQTYGSILSKKSPNNEAVGAGLKGSSYKIYRNIIESKQLSLNTNISSSTNIGIYGDTGISLEEVDRIIDDAEIKVKYHNDFEKIIKNSPLGGILPNSTAKPYYVNGYGESVIISGSWNKVTREIRVGSGRQDTINLTPLFTSPIGQDSLEVKVGGTPYTINDLVRFRIQALNTDSPGSGVVMVFRAYLTELSDDVTAEWNGVKYAGRGEKFYTYNGFDRKMSIGFKVAALSAKEMQPMYQKLNYLMSNLMPDYSGVLMRGPFVRMTIGNYIDSQPGVLTSLNYKIANDTPWEIALNEPITNGGVKEMVLPHIIDVSLGFTPIGSQTWASNELPRKANYITHIAQNYNGASEKSNYIVPGDAFNLKPGIPSK